MSPAGDLSISCLSGVLFCFKIAFIWYTMCMTERSERKNAYFVREKNEQALVELDAAIPLFGSDVRVAASGEILYATYRDLAKSIALPPNFIRVSLVQPNADIFAPNSRTTSFKEIRVNRVKTVESAIRAMDHIMEGEMTREMPQLQTVASRAHELFDLFSVDYSGVSSDDFIAARQKTVDLLNDVHVHPQLILNEEKRRITDWLIKGSYGRDELGRNNHLVTIMALSAAYRHAVEKWKGIGVIQGKFARMREALIFERNFSRILFTEVESRLRDTALPATVYFQHPSKQADQGFANIIGLLTTTKFQLELPHVNPYKEQGQKASELIGEIISLLPDRRDGVLERKLFSRAHAFVTKTLTSTLEYPEENVSGRQ